MPEMNWLTNFVIDDHLKLIVSSCVDNQVQVLSWEHFEKCSVKKLAQQLHKSKEGRKEGNDFLTMHSTHFIYGYMASDMVKDHSDSEKGSPLPPHRLLFPINSKFFLYAPSHRQDSTYHGLCYTSRFKSKEGE